MPLDQTIQDAYNFIRDVAKAFGVIPAAYADLIDLGTGYHYTRLMLVNTTDADIVVKFVNSSITAEYTVPAGSDQTLDRFSHRGVIQYKYSTIPTIGYFKLTSWLGAQ